MKRMMLILNGIIPANSSQGSRPSESVLGLVRNTMCVDKYFLHVKLITNGIQLSRYQDLLFVYSVCNRFILFAT